MEVEEKNEISVKRKRQDDLPSQCAFCGKENNQLQCEITKDIKVVDIHGEEVVLDAHCFCNIECQQNYYQPNQRRAGESEYDHNRRVFYTQLAINKNVNGMMRKWFVVKTLDDDLIEDLQRVIALKMVETIIEPFIRFNPAPLLGMRRSLSILVSGQDLVYIAGDDKQSFRFRPVQIKGICGVYVTEYIIFILLQNGDLYETADRSSFALTDLSEVPLAKNVISVIHAYEGIIVLKKDGSIWMSRTQRNVYIGAFAEIPTARDNVAIGGSSGFALVVKIDGSLWYIGSLPASRTTFVYAEKFTKLLDSGVASVKCFGFIILAIMVDGSVLFLDRSGNFSEKLEPEIFNSAYGLVSYIDKEDTLRTILTTQKIVERATDVKAFCVWKEMKLIVLKNDNTLWVLGVNEFGELGMKTRNINTLTQIEYLPPLNLPMTLKKPRITNHVILLKEDIEDLVQFDDGPEEPITLESLDYIRANCAKISNGQLVIRKTNHGLGVFTRRNFVKGEIITYYAGPIYDKKEVDRNARRDETWRSHTKPIIPTKKEIVGNRSEETRELIEDPVAELYDKGVGAYINDPRINEKRFNYNSANVRYRTIDTRKNQEIFIKIELATRAMKPSTVSSFEIVKSLQLMTAPKDLDINERLIGVLALKDIPADTELLVVYGKDYWM